MLRKYSLMTEEVEKRKGTLRKAFLPPRNGLPQRKQPRKLPSRKRLGIPRGILVTPRGIQGILKKVSLRK